MRSHIANKILKETPKDVIDFVNDYADRLVAHKAKKLSKEEVEKGRSNAYKFLEL